MKLKKTNNNPTTILSGFLAVFILIGFFTAQSAFAGFDYMFFSINGDSTVTSMTQGDELFWGSNCDIGATINWEIWYDINSSSTIDPSLDFLLASENITDGNPITEADPILDGWAIMGAFNLVAEPGNYIFRAKDIATNSTLQKVLTMLPMPSPPNQITGQISIPGFPAPNSFLANRFINAESESGDEGAFLATTDINGFYSINIGNNSFGVEFFIEPQVVPGFVSSEYISAIVSGVVGGNDFVYTAATDSVWGFVKDNFGTLINFEGAVFSIEQEFDIEKFATTHNGRYVIYFSDLDKGDWVLEADDFIYNPTYLATEQFSFNHDTLGSFQHDIILTKTDAEIYVRVTENDGLPINNYNINAYSFALSGWTNAISGVGMDNIATLHVSSLDNSGWSISIDKYNEDFQMPLGLIVLNNYIPNVSPGETVTLEIIEGQLIAGTIAQDPEDSPIFWEDVIVNASNFGFLGNYNFDARVGDAGNYSLYTDTGLYSLSVYAEGYVTDPAWRSIDVIGDTTGSGLGFTINETHFTLSGTLVDVPLPLDDPFYQVIARTGTNGTDGYYVAANVDEFTGTYSMSLSDGIWTITPPCCFNGEQAPDTIITIGEIPDIARVVDFVYTTNEGCCLTPGDANHDGTVDIVDLTDFVAYMFNGGQPPVCFEEFDNDGTCEDGIVNLTYFIDWMFGGGPAPVDCHICP